jgi:hypothetical protein
MCYHWASLTGNLADPMDYEQLCVSHHRAFDWAKVLGFTPDEAMARIKSLPALRCAAVYGLPVTPP